MGFVSLHNHSDHSLRDGFQSVETMLSYASALGQSAIALTDHGTMSGCGEGFRYADKYGIKFIPGCEHYLVPDVTIKDKFNQHIILLAMDRTGYRNLNILTTIAHSEDNFYFKPRIDLEILGRHSDGLICTTACLAGCQSKIKELKDIFGDRLYVEIHTNQLPEQKTANVQWLELADKYGVSYYAAVDAHYTLPTQSWFQRRWTGYEWEDDPNIYQREDGKWFNKEGKEIKPYGVCDDYYLHSEEQVRADLSYLPEDVVDTAINNTTVVSDRCNFQPEIGNNHYPKSPYKSPKDEIRMRVWSGMKEKGLQKDKKHIEQVKHELDILEKVDYFDYFLIVSDMLNHCKHNNIRTGVGRGSVVGCDIAYLMGITKIDPIKNGLIFERFAHTERVTPPDIDTDVPRGKRQDVIQYLKDTYGHVYQVATFNKMADKACMRRACQALHVEPKLTDRMAKRNNFDECEDIFIDEKDKFLPGEIDLLKKISKQFNGKIQNFGTHASAVVVMTTDPYDFCAVERFSGTKGAQYNLNYDFHDLESMGLLKLDILGLETLDIIDDTISMIKEEDRPNMDNLPDGDVMTYDLLRCKDTAGLFQLEGGTVTSVLCAVSPSNLSELTAVVALGRPGTLQSGMTQRYISSKRNDFIYSALDRTMPKQVIDMMDDTCGCLIYQEQVMEIARNVWGMSMGEADMLRRACARKDPELMKNLIKDMQKRKNLIGLSDKQVKSLLDVIGKASGYLFNKSHSAAYAYTAYQTAYLKAHYPMQFYCALLNSGIDQEKMLEYMSEISKTTSNILPPSILKSESKWTIHNNQLMAGFSSIRGIGSQEFIRPSDTTLESFEQFVKDNINLNKQVLTNIVYACCFDVDPIWARDYIDWYKEADKRKKECEERIEKFKGNEKKVQEWTEKMNQISPPPSPDNYNTSLEEVRKLQVSVLGYSSISPFSFYDKSLCSSKNLMISVEKVSNAKTKKDGSPLVFVEGIFQRNGLRDKIIFYRPSEENNKKLQELKKGDVIVVRCRWASSLVYYGEEFIYAKRVA